METTHIDDLLTENEEALKPVNLAIEGLIHMDEQQDLKGVTEEDVQHLQDEYETRRSLHKTVEDWALGLRAAVEALLDHGYPQEPSPEVNKDVTDDLDQNIEAINYARSRFRVRPLTVSASFEARDEQAPSE